MKQWDGRLAFYTAGIVGASVLSLPIAALPEVDRCSTAAACNLAGTKALEKRKVDDAITIFLRQLSIAQSMGGQKDAVLVAYNNLALAYLKKNDDLHALVFARLALGVDSTNKAALYHLKILKERLNLQRRNSIVGTYHSYAGLEIVNTLKVFEVKEGAVHFSLYARQLGGSHADGDLEGVATLEGEKAVYVMNDPPRTDSNHCKITMRFMDMAVVEVVQDGAPVDCGFGANVSASDEYWKVSN